MFETLKFLKFLLKKTCNRFYLYCYTKFVKENGAFYILNYFCYSLGEFLLCHLNSKEERCCARNCYSC